MSFKTKNNKKKNIPNTRLTIEAKHRHIEKFNKMKKKKNLVKKIIKEKCKSS